jgi:hypothetical protein
MKVIISESQYKNIFESSEKNRKLIVNMINRDIAINEIHELTGIEYQTIYELIYDHDFGEDIRCDVVGSVIMNIIENTDLINTKIKYHRTTIELDVRDYDLLILDFYYKDPNYAVEGSATPFMDGCLIPIDVFYFEDLDSGEYDNESNPPTLYVKLDSPKYKFRTIKQMVDFMNNDYIDLLLPQIDAGIDYYRDIINSREQ